MNHLDTIFALSSGPGVAGVAVIRLSGTGATMALLAMTGGKLPEIKQATLATLFEPKTHKRLDKALVLYFKGPASFTGEDVVELHVHGGVAVVSGVLEALTALEGLRLAEPGEFSRRAFEHGKMDLTEAEGLADLIHAQTSRQRDQALRQMDGALRTIYEDWRKRLIAHLAHLEADIDFPDEDLPEGIAGQVKPEISAMRVEIAKHLADGRRGRQMRDGFRIVILGAPNAGKSTLMNALARSDVAIVSGEAGTTRDAIEVQLDLGGFPVRLIDTAGLREGGGSIEQEGMRRTRAHASEADLCLVMCPSSEWGHLSAESKEMLHDRAILVLSKVDECPVRVTDLEKKNLGLRAVYPLSATTGIGMEAFLHHMTERVANEMGRREAPSLTRLRHQTALFEVVDHLERFEDNAGLDSVLAAEDARMAVRALGSITGMVHVEDILDVVFSDFCIGK